MTNRVVTRSRLRQMEIADQIIGQGRLMNMNNLSRCESLVSRVPNVSRFHCFQSKRAPLSCLMSMLIIGFMLVTANAINAQAGTNQTGSIEVIDNSSANTPQKITVESNPSNQQSQTRNTEKKQDPNAPRLRLTDEQVRQNLNDRVRRVEAMGNNESPNAVQQGAADQDSETAPDAQADEKQEFEPSPWQNQTLGEIFENANDSDNVTGDGAMGLGGGWMLQTATALGVVIALIFLVRWFLMKKMGVRSGGRNPLKNGLLGFGARGPVEVLDRTSIGNKTQVVLIRINHRVMAVTQCGGQVSTLCEITDPEEVAQLIGNNESSKVNSRTQDFGTYLDEAERGQSDQVGSLARLGSAQDEYSYDKAKESVSGLSGMIRGLRGRVG